MTPEERQLLSGLFDRIHGAANQPRDRDAETFIGEAVRAQPYAPYLLAQTVIVQEQALRAANDRLQELEAQLQEATAAAAAAPAQETSFLGSIGKSLFGAAPQAPQGQPRQPAPSQSPNQGGYGGSPNQGGYGGAPQPNPYAQRSSVPPAGPWGQQGNWGQQQPDQGFGGGAPQPQQGGGFLKGALGAAAGVAGGVLLADSIKGLFGGHNNPFGIASGGAGGLGQPGGETVVNNYYGDSDSANVTAASDARQDAQQDADDQQDYLQDASDDDTQQDFLQDASDDFDDGGSTDDDSYNV